MKCVLCEKDVSEATNLYPHEELPKAVACRPCYVNFSKLCQLAKGDMSLRVPARRILHQVYCKASGKQYEARHQVIFEYAAVHWDIVV